MKQSTPSGHINLRMTSDRAGETEGKRFVPIGTEVTYVAHVGGGMVRVQFADGALDVMHPNCFPTLR